MALKQSIAFIFEAEFGKIGKDIFFFVFIPEPGALVKGLFFFYVFILESGRCTRFFFLHLDRPNIFLYVHTVFLYTFLYVFILG